MWVKAVTIVVSFVAENKEARTFIGAVIIAILSPVILALILVISAGKAASDYNNNMASFVIGENDKDTSYLPNPVTILYTDTRNDIAELTPIWDEMIMPDTFNDKDKKKALEILFKTTYFMYLIDGNEAFDEEVSQDYLSVFVANDKADDIFASLSDRGVYLSKEDKINIFNIWSTVVYGRRIETNEDVYGIWCDYEGLEHVELVDGMYANPLNRKWEDVVSSEFGERIHPIFKTRKMHNGIDLAVPTGTEIYSSSAGVVTVSMLSSSAGNYITVKADDGYTFHYMHMSKRALNVGDKVNVGDLIGYVGSTGNSTGPHLHFGVKDPDGNWINPRDVVSGQ